MRHRPHRDLDLNQILCAHFVLVLATCLKCECFIIINNINDSISAAKNERLMVIYFVPGTSKNHKDYALFPGLSVPGESLSVPQARLWCLRLFSTLPWTHI